MSPVGSPGTIYTLGHIYSPIVALRPGNRRRTLPAGAVIAIGVCLVSLFGWHVSTTENSLATAGMDLLLVVFGGTIALTGISLWGGSATATELWRLVAWMAGASVAVALIGVALFVRLDAVSVLVESPTYLALAAVGTGASGGLLVGWNELGSRRRGRAISENERLFGSVFDGTLDALVLADDGGAYVEANQSASELFGVPRAELLGKRISDFTGPDVDFGAAWATFQASETQRGLFQIQRPDGETRMVEFAATRDVLPGRHLSALRDVTERERSQQRVAAQREQLSFLNRMLRHHVRNNLQIVVAHAERLNSADDASATAILDRIDAIEEFLERVRQFTASLAHDQPLHTVSIEAVLSEATASVAELAPNARIDVDVPDVGVVADVLLTDVFVNLVSNAVQHNDGETPHVQVRAVTDDETVTVTVSDDGPGIDDDHKEDVFEWLDSPAADVGFGLYLTRALVTRYGGRVWAGDADDLGGAAFSVQLHRDLHDAVSTERPAAVHRL